MTTSAPALLEAALEVPRGQEVGGHGHARRALDPRRGHRAGDGRSRARGVADRHRGAPPLAQAPGRLARVRLGALVARPGRGQDDPCTVGHAGRGQPVDEDVDEAFVRAERGRDDDVGTLAHRRREVDAHVEPGREQQRDHDPGQGAVGPAGQVRDDLGDLGAVDVDVGLPDVDAGQAGGHLGDEGRHRRAAAGVAGAVPAGDEDGRVSHRRRRGRPGWHRRRRRGSPARPPGRRRPPLGVARRGRDHRGGASTTVAKVTRSCAVDPLSTTATGRSGATPAARAAAQIRGSAETAMRRTTVAPAVRAPSIAGSAPAWPEVTSTEVATPRWVTGMPASAGTEKAEVMPGTTSTSTPATRQACTSSPPRPKT